MSENTHPPKRGHYRSAKGHTDARTTATIARKLLDVIVYHKHSRIGDMLTLDDLIETSDIGDWKMSDFEMARNYAAAQGWLIIEGDRLTLTTAGSAAA
jgi:hypothetical protein